MFKIASPVFFICETPLHAGSGDSLGVVDLPIQRERHTSFPKIESSSLKGAIRQAFEEYAVIQQSNPIDPLKPNEGNNITYKLQELQNINFEDEIYNQLSGKWKEEIRKKDKHYLLKYHEAVELAFGPENAGGDGFAGALGFTDARLLLFPVKSMKGVFAWITCPRVLNQFYKDFLFAKISNLPQVEGLESKAPMNCSLFVCDNKIVLEEYTIDITREKDNHSLCGLLAKWLSDNVTSDYYWKNKMCNDIIVLKDDDFTDFVNLTTEVITRTKIDNVTGTVESGALFTEEYLPAESVLYSLVLSSPIFKEKNEEKGVFSKTNKAEERLVSEFFKFGLPKVIQVGGNATLGKGLIRTHLLQDNGNGGHSNA